MGCWALCRIPQSRCCCRQSCCRQSCCRQSCCRQVVVVVVVSAQYSVAAVSLPKLLLLRVSLRPRLHTLFVPSILYVFSSIIEICSAFSDVTIPFNPRDAAMLTRFRSILVNVCSSLLSGLGIHNSGCCMKSLNQVTATCGIC
jgi:hypothetical protein